MAATAKYRIEHVEKKPRGWRVRSRLSGSHVLRIGFPPGSRRRGAGRLLEVLHPKAEARNPRCQMSEWAENARRNPEELVIFGLTGNPSRRQNAQAYGVYSTRATGQMQLETTKSSLAAADRLANRLRDQGHAAQVVGPRDRLYFPKKLNPEDGESEEVFSCPHCAQMFTPEEVETGEFRQHMMEHRAAREAGQVNPIHMHIRPDRATGKFLASMYDERYGNLYATGYTKKQAAKALREEWRRVRRTGSWRNPGRNPGKPRVTTYQLLAGTGRPIRKASKVVFPDGREVKLLERLPKAKAIREAERQLGLGSPNPARRRRRNPISETEQAVRLFEVFHGKDAKEIVEKHVSAAMRKDYTAIGKLIAVITDDEDYGEREIAQKWDRCPHIDFSEDHVTLASSPDGRQLYAIGGNQNLNGCLEKFEGVDPTKDFVDLGEVAAIVYEARKIHDNFEPVQYVHKFGGQGSARPAWMYDRLKKQIFFLGGEYHIDTTQKISPGIEG